jgi:hypothetical protein
VKCTQDHAKITAGAMPGMLVRCGICGKDLSSDKKYTAYATQYVSENAYDHE